MPRPDSSSPGPGRRGPVHEGMKALQESRKAPKPFKRPPAGSTSGSSSSVSAGGSHSPRSPRGPHGAQGRENERDDSDLVIGIHAVHELLLQYPLRVNQLFLPLATTNLKHHELQKLCKLAGIKVHQVPLKKISAMTRGNHQGAVAVVTARELDHWVGIKAKLLASLKEGKTPLVVLAAAIEDPRNLGAIVRSSVGLGAEAVLIPEKGSCGWTQSAAKSASGMDNHIALCRVGRLEEELQELSQAGFLVLGLDAAGTSLAHEVDLKQPAIFAIGGEDRGLPPHVARSCKAVVRLPMDARLPSYNASVALSLLLYEAARQKGFGHLGTEATT